MNFQGKSKNSYEASTKAVGYSIIGMIILLIWMTLFGGCTTIKDTSEKSCCKKETTK